MKNIIPIFKGTDHHFCHVEVPPIDNHKNGVFEFTTEQKNAYGQSQTHPFLYHILYR